MLLDKLHAVHWSAGGRHVASTHSKQSSRTGTSINVNMLSDGEITADSESRSLGGFSTHEIWHWRRRDVHWTFAPKRNKYNLHYVYLSPIKWEVVLGHPVFDQSNLGSTQLRRLIIDSWFDEIRGIGKLLQRGVSRCNWIQVVWITTAC